MSTAQANHVTDEDKNKALLLQTIAFLETDREKMAPEGGKAEKGRVIATLQQIADNTLDESGNGYAALKSREDKIGHIGKANGTLQWYRDTGLRNDLDEQISNLSVLTHQMNTSEKTGVLIAQATKENLADAWDRRNLTIIKRDYDLAKAVPEKMVKELSEATSACYQIWADAKPKDDWKAVRHALKKVWDLTIEQAKIYGDVLGCDPYDAQLRLYAPGNSQALIDPSFDALAKELPSLVQEIVEKQKTEKPGILFRADPEKLVAINRDIADVLGFPSYYGRLDESPHPFSSGTKYDSRMTTFYKPEYGVLSSVYGTIHETGHALYTLNVPEEWENQPVGALNDMTLHESQSMTMERQACGEEDFLSFLYERIAKHDPNFTKQGSLEDFIRSFRKVTPSLIRVEADEVTYPLHPMFRYAIEKEMFKGSMNVDDIPDAWNQKVKEYLGIDVPSYKTGCMQDVHWHAGLIGYFPTYAQGALNAAQLYAAAKRAIPDMETRLAKGDFSALNAWNKENVHRWGMLLDSGELIKNATGETPNAKAWLAHVRKRYLQI